MSPPTTVRFKMTLIAGITTPPFPFGHIGLIVADGRYTIPGTNIISEGSKILSVSDSLCVCPAGLQNAYRDESGTIHNNALPSPAIQAFLVRQPTGRSPQVLLQIAIEAVQEGWRKILPDTRMIGLVIANFSMVLPVGGWHKGPNGPATFLLAAQRTEDEITSSALIEGPNQILPLGQEDNGTLERHVAAAGASAPPWYGPCPNAAEFHLLRGIGAGIDSYADKTNTVGGPKMAAVIRPGIPICCGIF